jgi:hypothetical protein
VAMMRSAKGTGRRPAGFRKGSTLASSRSVDL